MDKNKKGKSSLWKVLFVCCAVVGGVGLVVRLVTWIAIRMLVPDAASIGIIGGADGPTAVFVTSSVSPEWYILALAVLLLVGLWGYSRISGRKKTD